MAIKTKLVAVRPGLICAIVHSDEISTRLHASGRAVAETHVYLTGRKEPIRISRDEGERLLEEWERWLETEEDEIKREDFQLP